MAMREAVAKEYKYKDVEVWNKRGLLKEGMELNGHYIAKEDFESQKYGPGSCFIIRRDDGTLAKVMGQTDVKAKMASIPLGSRVVITYKGLVETDRGSKKAYTINYDDEDIVEVESKNA